MVDQSMPLDAAAAVKLAQEYKKNPGSVNVFEERDENGYLIIANKRALVGKAFLILKWEYDVAPGNIDRVQVFAVTDDGKPVRFSDTGSGVYKQLSSYRGEIPVHAAKGLRVSDYTYNGEPASTFYLDFHV